MSDTQADHDHAHHVTGGNAELSYCEGRFRAIESLLIEKEVCTKNEVLAVVDELRSRSPADGARVVARAWTDPEFKERLLADPIAAVAELGYIIPDEMPRLTVLENTEKVHHLVVCTLSSCYPRALLGLPPSWYKSLGYRSRAVVDPRGVKI